MKKKFVLLLILCFMFFPFSVLAKAGDGAGDDYKSLNLVEALKEEEIDQDFSDYSENENQATIYLFRGKGCGYCRSFLTYLNGIVDDYGKYFKVVSYEVWKDSDNSALMKKVASFLGEEVTGVPYIVIGDKTFSGYSSAYDEDIESAIMDLYNSEDKYDVFEEMNKDDKKSEGTSSGVVVVWNFIFLCISTGAIMAFVNYKDNKLKEEITEIIKSKETNEKKDKEITNKKNRK